MVSEANLFSIGSTTDDYNAGLQYIHNGGTDLYNEGNYIQVPALTDNYVTYLENCAEGTVNGEQYSMAINGAGYSVLVFTNYGKVSIAIGGELGADGEGLAAQGTFEYNGWNGFWKTVNECHPNTGADCDGHDPTLHHLWITDSPIANTSHDIATDTDDDRDVLSVESGFNVVYLMWATQAGTTSSDLVIQELIQKVADEFSK